MAELSEQQTEVDGTEKSDLNSTDSISKMDTAPMSYDKKDKTSKKKISTLDIETFCDRLEVFVSEAQRFRKNVSGYPVAIQERLNNDIRNLEFLFIETQETVRSIQKIKTQHKFVKKDLGNTEKLLKKLKQEEIREIENQILRCDANIYKVWETLKKTKNTEGVESFLAELQEKKAALERLSGLVSQKLSEIQETPLALIQFHSPVTKLRDKAVKSLTYETRKFSRPLRSKKRKHSDQNDRNDVFVTIEDAPTLAPPTLPPLPMGPIALTLAEGMSYSISESTRITASSQSLTNTTTSSATRTESTIRDEMQTVFDALFGDLKQENDGQYEQVLERRANITNSSAGFDYMNYDLNFL